MVKKIIIYIVLFLAGYITGSIHAPFELRWRTDTFLPDEGGYSLEERQSMNLLLDEGITNEH